MRAIARDRGWSLSEHGFARLTTDGEVATGADAEVVTFASEEEVYRFLELPWIAPELREDRGEIEAAREGRLPTSSRPPTYKATATPTATGRTATCRSRG